MKRNEHRRVALAGTRARRRPTTLALAASLALAMGCGPDAPQGQPQLPSGDASSSPEAQHPEANAAISQLRSPYCPGFMLEVCTSREAEILRDSIQALAGEGLNADSLVEWMIARHGEEYRALPKRSGTGLLAWAAPPAMLLLGLGVVVVALRRLMSREKPGGADEALTESEEARLAEALAELERMEDPR